MAMGAVLAAALTDHSARSKGLYIAGVDVIKQPGGGYGVPIESVEVIEAGPGGVSSMTCRIDDPNIALTISAGMDVRFHDITNDVPIFLGWVQHWSYKNAFGDTGRIIELTCIGVEAILDWCIVPSITIANSAAISYEYVQSACAMAVGNGIGVLRVMATVGDKFGTQAAPLGTVHNSSTPNYTQTISNVTLRECIRLIYVNTIFAPAGITPLNSNATVDFYGGLRMWRTTQSPFRPNDYTDLTVTDTSVGAVVAEKLDHETDAAGIVRNVWVVGGNAAGTRLVSDGTGLPGATAVLTDASILTSDDAAGAGTTYLADFQIGNRGTFEQQDWTPTFTLHPGSLVTITDTRISQAGVTYVIGDITKRFNAVRQDWQIAYGGLMPSVTKSMRRLTRSTLS
jgi:hypothetical protein